MKNDERLSLNLDLTCRGDRSETLPFRISLRADALPQLMEAAVHGDRIYELFSIRRHGDIKRYLWVRVIEAAERITRRYQWMSEKYKWPETAYPFSWIRWDYRWNAKMVTATSEFWSKTNHLASDHAFSLLSREQRKQEMLTI